MAGVKKQDDTESSRSKLRAEAEKKVARSADKSAPLKKQVLDKLVHELRVHQVELEMQNEELRGAQEQIAKSRNDYADLYDFSPVGYLSFDGDALITGVNLTGAALLGVERQKLLKSRFRQFVAPVDVELWDRHFVSVLQQGEKQSCDLLLRRKDGSTLHARLDSIRVEMDDGTFLVRTGMSDITIQKQAEESLQREHIMLARTEGIAHIGSWEWDIATDTVTWSDESFRIFQRDPQEGAPSFADQPAFYHPEDFAVLRQAVEAAVADGTPYALEIRAIRKDGKTRACVARGVAEMALNGRASRLFGSLQDISERKKAEEMLRKSDARYRLLAEHTTDVIRLLDMDLKTTYLSPSAEKQRGFTLQEMVGMPLERQLTPESLRTASAILSEEIPRVESDPDYNPIFTLDLEYYCKDGTKVWTETKFSLIRNEKGKAVSILAEARDITERKQSEVKLRESEVRFRELFNRMSSGVAVYEAIDNGGDFIIRDFNPAAEKIERVSMKDILGMRVTEVFTGVKTFGIFEVFQRVWQTGKPEYFPPNIYKDERDPGSWRESWVFKLPTGEIVAVYNDITERKLSEEKLAKSYENLQKTLNDSINTIVKIVEIRDPYTAGHQQKVADLATAIAGEMKLEDARIDNLRMAAIIHDIGKMHIPSDILSRPGKLTNMEFSLIKTHAQAGFDIVKGMDLPCNVAKTVLQHHERLDGSGYPNQLKGEDTLLEAKILAVADVIEAMASHRPYRPALGIDKALEEISHNRGKIYDPAVVDACLKLFQKEGFKFTEPGRQDVF